jgi:hypothetical protein
MRWGWIILDREEEVPMMAPRVFRSHQRRRYENVLTIRGYEEKRDLL